MIVGRAGDAGVRIKSNELSRVQCKLECIKHKWYLSDGDGAKKSTNGTWLYVEAPFEVYDGIVFKAGSLLFEGKLH